MLGRICLFVLRKACLCRPMQTWPLCTLALTANKGLLSSRPAPTLMGRCCSYCHDNILQSKSLTSDQTIYLSVCLSVCLSRQVIGSLLPLRQIELEGLTPTPHTAPNPLHISCASSDCFYELCIMKDSLQKREDGHFLSTRINNTHYTQKEAGSQSMIRSFCVLFCFFVSFLAYVGAFFFQVRLWSFSLCMH